jgi:hypothetical protein
MIWSNACAASRPRSSSGNGSGQQEEGPRCGRTGIDVQILIAAALMMAVATQVLADGRRLSAARDPVVKEECGKCHLAFPPHLLPRRSWQKIIDSLSEHPGGDVSLPEARRRVVLDYLLAHAADAPSAGKEGRKVASSIPPNETPLRITETTRWRKRHREVRSERWTSPKVKSKANCPACHKSARST